MKRSAVLLCLVLLAAGVCSACAQVAASATTRRFSLTAGGTVSLFQPDFEGGYNGSGYPIAQADIQPLIGVGAFVDVKFTRWVQLEAEGRWQRFHAFEGITEDNYLIGPRVPVLRFWKATVYGKALGGYSNMNYGYGNVGPYTTIAFGGGMDLKLNRRLSLRAADFEYQYWPVWEGSKLSPYGVSAGIGYRIF
jgi:hypothetical protein